MVSPSSYDEPVPLARRCRRGTRAPSRIVSKPPEREASAPRPPRSARTARSIVTLLDSRQDRGEDRQVEHLAPASGRSGSCRGRRGTPTTKIAKNAVSATMSATMPTRPAVGQRPGSAPRRGVAAARHSYFQSGSSGCFRSHSGRRLRTTGSVAKLYSGGGDVVDHSSVQASHGSSPAGCARDAASATTFHRKTGRRRAWKTTPTRRRAGSRSPSRARPRRCRSAAACRAGPRSACGAKVRLKPMTKSQKCQRPSVSLEHAGRSPSGTSSRSPRRW